MGAIQQIYIQLKSQQNDTMVGSLVLEDKGASTTPVATIEADPKGAASYVVAVVLMYGLSIVFLIGSHVFIKKKEESIEGEERIVDKFLEQSGTLREITNKQTYQKLKKSIIPVVARSPAKNLVSRRRSFLPLLVSAGINLADPGGLMSGISETKGSSDGGTSSPGRKVSSVMPSIGEEDEEAGEVSSTGELEAFLRNLPPVTRGYSQESDISIESSNKSQYHGVNRLSKKAQQYLIDLDSDRSSLIGNKSNPYKLTWVSESSNYSSQSSNDDIAPVHISNQFDIQTKQKTRRDSIDPRRQPYFHSGATVQSRHPMLTRQSNVFETQPYFNNQVNNPKTSSQHNRPLSYPVPKAPYLIEASSSSTTTRPVSPRDSSSSDETPSTYDTP